MNQILCSTGALIGRPNGRNYRLLEQLSAKLNCDGFEFMIYDSWYTEIEELIDFIKSLQLNIPVIHCDKSLGETLCGIKVWREGDNYPVHIMREEEDRACFEEGIEKFILNLKAANAFGAKKMVLHLWNGLPSDKNINKNIERFGVLKALADKAGVELMVENVICNTMDPLYNISLLHDSYPSASFVFDTKMAEFHGQTMKVFESEYEWLFRDGHVKHLHVNDYNGGYMDWGNFKVLPIGKGHVDFDSFFEKLFQYDYHGDYTVEATGFDIYTGEINIDMLNKCFGDLRELIEKYA